MSHQKMSNFVSFALFRLTVAIVIKLRNFAFESNCFEQFFVVIKKIWCQI